MRKYNCNNEYLLLPYTWRFGSSNTILEYMDRSGKEGTKAAKRKLDHSRVMAG
jgi:hypothetical protein